MRATGIVRKMDDLGRVVIPSEVRRTLDIKEQDGLEIYIDGEFIILKKYAASCAFCGSRVGLKDFKGKKVCKDCAKEAKWGAFDGD